MEEVEELLSATTKWSLGSSKSISNESLLSSGADEEKQSSSGIVSPQHVMSDNVLELSSTAAVRPPTLPTTFDNCIINKEMHQQTLIPKVTKSSSPSYTNNPSVWAPLSISNADDFICNPSVLEAAMSGTSNIIQSSSMEGLMVPDNSLEEIAVPEKQLVATAKEFEPKKLSPTKSRFERIRNKMVSPMRKSRVINNTNGMLIRRIRIYGSSCFLDS